MNNTKLTEDAKKELRKDMGKLLKNYRTQAGYTAMQFADATGMSPQYFPEAEGGRQLPSLYVIYQVCQVLGITLSDFFNSLSASPDLISAEEMDIIAKYRECSLRERSKIKDLLDLLVDRAS